MVTSFQDYKIQKIIKNVKSISQPVRVQAMLELSQIKPDEIHVDLGIRILREAAKGCPISELWMQDASNIIVTFIADGVKEEYIPVVEEIFPKLSMWARSSALRLISLIPTEESARAYLRIIKAHHQTLEFDQLPIEYDPKNESVTKILFPELFSYLNHPDLIYYVLSYANGCLEEGTLSQEVIAPFTTELRQLYWRLEKQYEQDLAGLDDQALWDEETQDARDLLGILLDVIGDIEGEEIEAFMDKMISHPDKKLSFFAILSNLRKKRAIDQRYIDELIEDLEMRIWFYDELTALGRLDMVKPESITQEKMAEGEMVRWLSYPTELGHVPTEIEQAGIMQDEDRVYYIYRFRTEHPYWEDFGFMAGMAGPYQNDGTKITGDVSHTFSVFEPWEEKTLEGHMETLLTIVQEYWQQKNTETE